ncbi:cytochrome b/b6 domain-containing protein [Carboxylicivirga mesophila]|uniref:Cytochrome b/b6 domain-containing protein n=1 Tax=Carboxylicivirga mesophila TaxID=1166478 RepID=A0ABS5K7Z5_9BACT|nr:cytochrome b/b6 domain-containing protein [Carboxylicivirga mesophila]MBS2211091.1 cytochrome b/b6 domain-containing protein [Carboxylicivirga mesophila]
MSDRLYLYPVWIRIWHAVNALCFLVLLISGISMQYSNPAYPLLPFDVAVSSHNVSGIVIFLAYLFFLAAFVFTSNKKHYKIRFKGMSERLFKQIRYYTFGVFKGESSPYPTTEDAKFNPLQQVTYVGVIFVLYPILIITGLALMFPEAIIDNFFGIGGTLLTALLHASAGFLASLFLVIHLYFATMGASVSANFKSIVNGYHESH